MKTVRKPCANHRKPIGKPQENYKKTTHRKHIGKQQENNMKTTRKLEENNRKIIRKP